MSHAHGLVKFPDGTIKHFEYDGTSDICCPKLWDTSEEVDKHWREEDRQKQCTCGKEPEIIEIYSSYGGGYWWKSTGCKQCNVIIDVFTDDKDEVEGCPDWVDVTYPYVSSPED